MEKVKKIHFSVKFKYADFFKILDEILTMWLNYLHVTSFIFPKWVHLCNDQYSRCNIIAETFSVGVGYREFFFNFQRTSNVKFDCHSG